MHKDLECMPVPFMKFFIGNIYKVQALVILLIYLPQYVLAIGFFKPFYGGPLPVFSYVDLVVTDCREPWHVCGMDT